MKKYEATERLSGASFEDIVRTLTVADGIVVNQDFSLGVAFRLTPQDTSAMPAALKEGIHSRLRATLNALPDHFDLEFRHVPVFRTRELDQQYEALTGSGAERKKTLIDEIADEEREITKASLQRKEVRVMRLYCILVRKMPLSLKERRKRTSERMRELRAETDGGKKPTIGTKMARIIEDLTITYTSPGILAQYRDEEYKDAVNELLLYSRTLHQGLADTGLDPEYCDDASAIEIFYSYWNRQSYDNGSKPLPVRKGQDLPMSDYYALSNLDWDPQGKVVPRGMYFQDGLFHAIIGMTTPPEVIGLPRWPHFEDPLLFTGPKQMEMIVKIVPGNKYKREQLLVDELRKAENALRTKTGQDNEREQKRFNEIKAELSNLRENNDRPWHTAIYFHLWSDKADKLTEAATQMKTLANELNIELSQETWGLTEYFRATQPFWTQDRDTHRMFVYSTAQLIGMLPICGQVTNIKPSQPLGPIYETATGSLFNFFPHNVRRTANAHVAICAGSRKGKSTLVGGMVPALSRYSLRMAIIDLGGSYRKLCEALGGNYVEFDLTDRSKCLNPLFIDGNILPDETELRSRLFCVEQMLCNTRRGERFDKDDIPRITEALSLTYKSHMGEEVTLSDLKKQFQNMGLQQWATRLHDWTGETTKGGMFDGKNTLSMANRFTVFDFQRVKDDQELAPVLFHIATNTVAQLSAGYPTDLKIALCDEASQFLRLEVTAEFIDQAIRTLAKHGVGFWTLSQNFSDFTTLELTKETFLNNVSTWIFLGQDSTDICDEIGRAMSLPDSVVQKLKDLKTIFGQYSEFVVLQKVGGVKEVTHCYNISTPLKYAITTTAAPDRVQMNKLLETMPLPDAIRAFAERYPNGADAQFSTK